MLSAPGGTLSALIGTIIVVGLASYLLRRRQARTTPSPGSPTGPSTTG